MYAYAHTAPRVLVAEFVRKDDDIAVYPVPGKHQPDQPCDCPSATTGESRQQRHCSTRHLPVRGMTFLEHNVAAVLWCRVIGDPQPAVRSGLWFGIPRIALTVLPLNSQGGPLARFIVDQRDPMVIRERVRIEVEGQSETTGVTTDTRPIVPGNAPLRLVPRIDPTLETTQKLPSQLVPVGVQVVELGGVSPNKGRAHQHDANAAQVLDFVSERESN